MIYGNGEMGMEGLQKMEKCMITLLIIAGLVWIFLFGYRYFTATDASEKQGTGNAEDWIEQSN